MVHVKITCFRSLASPKSGVGDLWLGGTFWYWLGSWTNNHATWTTSVGQPNKPHSTAFEPYKQIPQPRWCATQFKTWGFCSRSCIKKQNICKEGSTWLIYASEIPLLVTPGASPSSPPRFRSSNHYLSIINKSSVAFWSRHLGSLDRSDGLLILVVVWTIVTMHGIGVKWDGWKAGKSLKSQRRLRMISRRFNADSV